MATIADYLEKKASILRRQGNNFYIECPGCRTRKAKCAVHIRRGVGNCFRASCSLHGGFGFIQLITLLSNCSYGEAFSIAAGYQDGVEHQFVQRQYAQNRNYPRNASPLSDMVSWGSAAEYLHAQLVTDYLVRKRKLSAVEISSYFLGVGTNDFTLEATPIPRKGMVVCPITFNGEIVSYFCRAYEIAGGIIARQKHYKAEAVEGYLPPSQTLFNADIAFPLARQRGYLPIFEDAWSAIRLGGVATLGSDISDEQLYLLKENYPTGIVISCRDNDAGGHRAEGKDVERLSAYYSDVRVVRPKGIDPDDYLEDTKLRLATAPPLNLFEYRLRLSFGR